jgi:hypothetical protein
LIFAFALGWTGAAAAWEDWDQGCSDGACHGDFRATPYDPPSGDTSWADGLHDVHRFNMLDGDCDVCHGSGPGFSPVSLNSSVGGDGLAAISCAGCHSRVEPDDGGNISGMGLRQHHFNAGTTDCEECHDDANPGPSFMPVGEDVLPPYYANPGNNHPNIPDDPCSRAKENFAGSRLGLDNDGDGAYDEDDVIDCPEPTGIALQLAALAALGGAGRMRRARRS